MKKIEIIREMQEITVIALRSLINELTKQKIDSLTEKIMPISAEQLNKTSAVMINETVSKYEVQIEHWEHYLDRTHELLKKYYETM